jgi:hypothetical protein
MNNFRSTSAIGVTRQHQILLEYVAAEDGTTKFKGLSDTDQEEVRTKAEEQYISYVFLRQSEKQHNKVKVDLHNDFTTGDGRYPKNCQQTLHLLDKYSKSSIVNRKVQQIINCEHNNHLRRVGVCSKRW